VVDCQLDGTGWHQCSATIKMDVSDNQDG
jgi:hypothetical protein